MDRLHLKLQLNILLQLKNQEIIVKLKNNFLIFKKKKKDLAYYDLTNMDFWVSFAATFSTGGPLPG